MKQQKTTWACSECGNESSKYLGRCPVCGSWNTMVEVKPIIEDRRTGKNSRISRNSEARSQLMSEVSVTDETRFSSGIDELDRVLGGGIVEGSFVLIGGEPGVGKSTLLMQICANVSRYKRVLYVSGEESLRQLKLRALRLNVLGDEFHVFAETCLENITDEIERIDPDLVIVDSIQTVFTESSDSAAGTASQIKACTQILMRCAKEHDITIFLVGHVTKEGGIAGPKILEHMVDSVIYFEGERHMSYRIIRAIKNRFGSTDEIGVFEMRDTGLVEITNPSAALLSGRPLDAPGSCIVCVMEGSRPILAEIQALVTESGFSTPRRMSAGYDYNRAMLLMAVLERRAGMHLSGYDTYINVTGGLKIDEPAADLPAVIAIASSFRDKAVDRDTVCIGELGLSGELRSVNSIQQRINEISRMGFTRCILPAKSVQGLSIPNNLQLIKVSNVYDAIEAALK